MTRTQPLPWRAGGAGLRLAVRLTPKGGREAIGGVVEVDGRPVLQVRVAAPPVDGAANAALTAFLAKRLGLSRGAVRVAAGATARVKILDLAGDPDALAARLEALV